MRVNFTNMDLSSPIIDLLVGSMVGFLVLSFLDTFFSYHQIKMLPNNYEKASFVMRQVFTTTK